MSVRSHPDERPALEVGALDVPVEPGAEPRVVHAKPQVDVLYRGVAEVLVEAVHGEEHVATDRPAPRPERARLRLALLVHVVVQEVLVLADPALVGGVVVVAAEHRGQLRLARHQRADALDGVGQDENVGIDEQQEVRVGGERGAVIAGAGRAVGPVVEARVARAERRRRRGGRAVARRVVDDEHA